MLKKRVVLWWLIIIGILCHMFQTTNINVAILSMVKKSLRSDQPVISRNDTFDWNEQQQSIIFGAYYWFSWASELCGGILSHKYGSKITFGLTTFIGCLLSSVISIAARIGWEVVVVVRVIQGTIASIGLPAGIVTIIGQWSPPDERGKFTSVFLGVPVGISIGYPFFGFIAEYFGWEYVFHITMALGAAWYLVWCYFVFDTPEEHPSISDQEKIYIRKSLANTITKEKIPIPWKKIFTSVPLWFNIICTFGYTWTFMATSIFLPKYLRAIYDISTTKIGIFTGISFLAKALMQIFSGVVTDHMVKGGTSKTRVRNFAVFVGAVIAGALLSGIKLVDRDVFWSLTLLFGYFLLSAFTNSGAPVAIIDMSPNFCGIILGVICGLTVTTGFFCSVVFSWLSLHFGELETWGYFFLSSGLLSVVPGILFILFSNSELQTWNSPEQSSGEVLRSLNDIDGD